MGLAAIHGSTFALPHLRPLPLPPTPTQEAKGSPRETRTGWAPAATAVVDPNSGGAEQGGDAHRSLDEEKPLLANPDSQPPTKTNSLTEERKA